MPSALRQICLVAVSLALAAPALAQKADLKAEALKDWASLKSTMVKIAAEMPEDKYGFKPTPPQRNYGEQVLHVAGANINFLKGLGGTVPAPAVDLKATSKAEIIKVLEASFDYGTALLEQQTPDSMLETVKAGFLGEASRARIISFLLGHTWDTYGQMAVYLRLNGHVPPASQRP
ncbi:MAG: DinB family protein [Acidimicrobiia bacterium]|nr:DinB family protein [Acidimicrobiia bacterium]